MTKFFFVLSNLIFISLVLFSIVTAQENLQSPAFLKNKLKMLEQILSQQRKDYLELKYRIEDIEKENSFLKEEIAVLEKETFLLERQKAILELMATKFDRDLKGPSSVKPDDNLDKAIYINLGYAYGMKGKIQDAIEEYSLALKYEPQDKDIHYNLGYLLAKKDRCKEAIEEYKKALTGQPSDREIYYNLAVIYSTCVKDKKMADYYYEKFLSIPSQNKGPAS